MVIRQKVCVVTGTRADYGHLYWLLREIQSDSNQELQLIVTGMHLSPEFGLTHEEIRRDGFVVNKKIEMLVSSDSEVGITKSIGLGLIGFGEAFDELKPDVVVVLGDRFEILSASIAALIARIPLAHIHGGEATEGVVDNQIRHAITKMASLHFPVTEEYRQRIIQMGENPDTVFNCGAPGLDNLHQLTLMNREELEEALNFTLQTPVALCTYHPVTLENNTAREQIEMVLSVLHKLDLSIIFTRANADTYGRIINYRIEEFVAKHSGRSILISNLGQLKYLSALKHVDLVIGNSSSGIIEAPSFHTPVVNIGGRQKGRIRAKNVIDVSYCEDEILAGIQRGLSSEFKEEMIHLKNPYDAIADGKNSYRIKEVIKSANAGMVKKTFYDQRVSYVI